jgi:hypothetical protein
VCVFFLFEEGTWEKGGLEIKKIRKGGENEERVKR